VALKVILDAEHASRDQMLRFLIEGETLARLRHANIVQVYEVGECQGRPFLAMEYVAGGALSQRCCGRRVPPQLAAQLVAALARAMHSAHQQGVIHRDLKPANILLQAAEGQSLIAEAAEAGAADFADLESAIPKITDFGVAKPIRAQAGLTRTGDVLGTPAYMAPEQADADPGRVGPAVDIYALGVILYELMTGAPPFQGETPLQTLQRVQRDEPVPPSQLLKGLPPDLNAIRLKCLEKNPGRRYDTGGDLAEDLERFLNHEPIRARHVGPLGRLARWCRRSPALAGLIGLAVLLLVTITVGSLLALMKIKTTLTYEATARAAAERSRREAVVAVARLSATVGDQYISNRDYQTAILWYARAWALDRSDPRRQASHHLRLAAAARTCPPPRRGLLPGRRRASGRIRPGGPARADPDQGSGGVSVGPDAESARRSANEARRAGNAPSLQRRRPHDCNDVGGSHHATLGCRHGDAPAFASGAPRYWSLGCLQSRRRHGCHCVRRRAGLLLECYRRRACALAASQPGRRAVGGIQSRRSLPGDRRPFQQGPGLAGGGRSGHRSHPATPRHPSFAELFARQCAAVLAGLSTIACHGRDEDPSLADRCRCKTAGVRDGLRSEVCLVQPGRRPFPGRAQRSGRGPRCGHRGGPGRGAASPRNTSRHLQP